MRKVKRLRAEKVIAIMVVASVCMLLAIPVIGYMFARPPIATGSTPAEVAQNKAEIDTVYTGAVFVIKALGVVGIAGILVSLASGLVIAFGIGPSWLARRHDGMVVQDKFGDDGLNKYFGQSVPNVPGVRFYVRVTLADGRPAEFFTDRETYRTIAVGQVLDARLLGRRLVKIESVADPSHG